MTDPATPVASVLAVQGLERNDGATLRKFVDVAGRVRTSPDDLTTCISFESRWNPGAVNKSSGATGLIQFMPSTALRLGTTVGAIAKMPAVVQLDLVERYLAPFAGSLATLEDCYLSIFWPDAVGQPADYVIAREGGAVFRQNPGMNQGSVITRDSATRNVRAVRAAAGGRRLPVPAAPLISGPGGALVLLAVGLALLYAIR